MCSRAEKEKQSLVIEIDTVLSQLDGATKARAHAEAKAEGMDDQIRRLKAQVDDLSRQNNDLSESTR